MKETIQVKDGFKIQLPDCFLQENKIEIDDEIIIEYKNNEICCRKK